jgi:hypothetical protein
MKNRGGKNERSGFFSIETINADDGRKKAWVHEGKCQLVVFGRDVTERCND